jgi:hypothetical protein
LQKIFSVHEGEGGPANSQAAQTQGPVQIDGCFVLNKGLLRGAVATQSAFVIRTWTASEVFESMW